MASLIFRTRPYSIFPRLCRSITAGTPPHTFPHTPPPSPTPPNPPHAPPRPSPRALDLDPQFHFYVPREVSALGREYLKGMRYQRNYQFPESLECFNNAQTLDSHFSEGWFPKGLSFVHLFQYDEALECFDRALLAQPGLVEAVYWRSYCLDKMGRPVEALDGLSGVPEAGWGDSRASAFQLLAQVHLKLQNLDSALHFIQKRADLLPNDMDNWRWLGKTYELLKSRDSLKYVQYESTRGFYVERWILKGLELKGVDVESAVECFEVAIEIDGSSPGGWLQKGICFYELQRYEEAICCFDKIIQLGDTSEGWYWKGISLFSMFRYKEALKCFEESVNDILQKHNEEYITNILAKKGDVHLILGQDDKAMQCYQILEELKLADPKCCELKANYSNKLGKLKKKTFVFKEAQQNSLNGDYMKSIKLINSLLPELKDDKEIWMMTGGNYEKLGDFQEALNSYSKVALLDPDLLENEKLRLRSGICCYHLTAYSTAFNLLEDLKGLKGDEMEEWHEYLGKTKIAMRESLQYGGYY